MTFSDRLFEGLASLFLLLLLALVVLQCTPEADSAADVRDFRGRLCRLVEQLPPSHDANRAKAACVAGDAVEDIARLLELARAAK